MSYLMSIAMVIGCTLILGLIAIIVRWMYDSERVLFHERSPLHILVRHESSIFNYPIDSLVYSSNMMVGAWNEAVIDGRNATNVLTDLRNRDRFLRETLPNDREVVSLYTSYGFSNIPHVDRPNYSESYISRMVGMGKVIVVDNTPHIAVTQKEFVWQDKDGKMHMAVTFQDKLKNHVIGNSLQDVVERAYTPDMQVELKPQLKAIIRGNV